jgi:hypothetical protein
MSDLQAQDSSKMWSQNSGPEGCGGMTPRETTLSEARSIAAQHGIDWRDIMSRSRIAPVARARRSVWLHFHRRGYSSCEIGRIFGRDHSTVLFGIKKELAA